MRGPPLNALVMIQRAVNKLHFCRVGLKDLLLWQQLLIHFKPASKKNIADLRQIVNILIWITESVLTLQQSYTSYQNCMSQYFPLPCQSRKPTVQQCGSSLQLTGLHHNSPRSCAELRGSWETPSSQARPPAPTPKQQQQQHALLWWGTHSVQPSVGLLSIHHSNDNDDS